MEKDLVLALASKLIDLATETIDTETSEELSNIADHLISYVS